jgi:hypothetical protein
VARASSSRKPLVIGPFGRGLNTFDDPTAIADTEVVECLNFDPGLDGSLRSRPPFQDLAQPLQLGTVGNARLLGYYYGSNGAPYLLASDGFNSTYAFNGVAWVLVTSTFSATAMTQFDGKAWLLSPVGVTNPGGSWTPAGGFVADANMPRGEGILAYKFRLWVVPGRDQPNGTRLYYSKVLGQANFWQSPAFVDVGAGDGQSIVQMVLYYNTLVLFRTQSIYTFEFSSDPALGQVSVLVPGVGLTSRDCVVSHENYLYFMFDEKAYEFINNRAQQINMKVPFTTVGKSGIANPFAVSTFNNRAIFHYYDTMFVYSLRTRTWTKWKSPQYGAIGQIMSPNTDAAVDRAYVLPSTQVGPSGTVRTNYALNGGFRDNTTGWTTANATVTRVTNAGVAHAAFIDRAIASAPNPGTGGSMPYAASLYRTMPVTGAAVRPFAGFRAKGTGVSLRVRMTYLSGSGAPLGNRETTFSLSGSWTTFYVEPLSATFPGTASVELRFDGFGDFYLDDVILELDLPIGAHAGKFFDGGTTPALGLSYAWQSTPEQSISTETRSTRTIPLLYIADAVGDVAEEFTCEIQTKNYNYELSSNYKRLFWWGVDAMFRSRIRAWAVPVTFTTKVSWNELLTNNVTWGDLLGGTWANPYSGQVTFESDYALGDTGPTRKFAKFYKGLRFRQIYFRLVFYTDGSISTAPVQVFTITADVGTKERVSKTLS